MRGRLSFALTAFTLLFLLQGWAALLATAFATAYDVVFPSFRAPAAIPLLVPLLALTAPLLPLPRLIERRGLVAGAALLTAFARVTLCLPGYGARLFAAALVVAGGSLFISAAVGYLERRSVAGGFTTAILLEQLLRLAGWSWDISLRAWWLLPQLGIGVLVAVIAAQWLRLPEPQGDEDSLERRAGGLRLRGALALGLLLFLDLNVLARPEIATRWLGVRYEIAAILLVCVSAAAGMLLLASQGALARNRSTTLLLTLLAAAGVLLTRYLGGWPGMALLCSGHGAALVLIGRALVPAGGRRPAWPIVAGLVLLLLFNTLYALTFFSAFTLPLLSGAAPWLFAAAAVLLFLLLMLLPRPVATRPRIRRKVWVALTLIAAVAVASLLSLRERPGGVREQVGDTLRVATWNVHYGFDEQWRYDPAAIAAALRAADVDVVALQEVTAALPTAYGTDLAIYLGRRLGMRVRYSPSINGLLGDAILTRVPPDSFATILLPPVHGDRKSATHLRVRTGQGVLDIFGTHFGLQTDEQRAQTEALLAFMSGATTAILLGDLNATDNDAALTALRQAGFVDAFASARTAPAPTWPSSAPETRIDWIMLRGAQATAATVQDSRASDHRLVTATVRVPRTSEEPDAARRTPR